MEIKKYEALASTVKHASLTLAAGELGLTQSAVSHMIASIESEIGFKVLVRSRTGAHLTSEGERLMPFIKEILRQEELLQKTVGEITGVAVGEIRIGTFTSVATNWLPSMIKEFQALYPGVSFRMFNGDYHDIDRWMSDGSTDLGFITLPTELKCACIPLKEDRLMAILPKGHPLAQLKVCPVEKVAREPFISLLEDSDHDARRALEKVNVRPNIKFTTKDDYAIIAMVSAGLGVSIMPQLLLHGHSEGIEIREIDPPTSRTLALAIASGNKACPAARRFAEFALSWVNKDM